VCSKIAHLCFLPSQVKLKVVEEQLGSYPALDAWTSPHEWGQGEEACGTELCKATFDAPALATMQERCVTIVIQQLMGGQSIRMLKAVTDPPARLAQVGNQASAASSHRGIKAIGVVVGIGPEQAATERSQTYQPAHDRRFPAVQANDRRSADHTTDAVGNGVQLIAAAFAAGHIAAAGVDVFAVTSNHQRLAIASQQSADSQAIDQPGIDLSQQTRHARGFAATNQLRVAKAKAGDDTTAANYNGEKPRAANGC
jgi:hypothetical protein